MRKILIVPSWQVWPLNSGGAHAQSVFLRDLSDLFKVHIVLTRESINDLAEFQAAFPKVVCHPFDLNDGIRRRKATILEKILKRLTPSGKNSEQELPDPYPIQRVKHLFKTDFQLQDFIQKIADKHDVDFLQFEMDLLIPVALNIRSKAKKILILHELPSLLIRQCIDELSYDSTFYQILFDAIRQYEKKAVQCFDKVVVFNEHEKKLLDETAGSTHVAVSPFTLNVRNSDVEDKYKVDTHPSLLFIGNGHHYPNLQGLTYFLDSIWPALIRQFPQLKLYIVGKWQYSIKKSYENEQVIFTGKISDEALDQHLLRSVMISPVLLTSGIRTKILYAASLGTPMVVHKNEMDCFNMSGRDQNGIKFCNATDDFVASIRTYLEDGYERKQASIANQKWFKENFDYSKCWEQRKRIYDCC